MTIYVDQLTRHGKIHWSHMMTDGDIEELHAMAARLGLKRSWFQDKNPRYPHYDVQSRLRALAIKFGAVAVNSDELIRRCVRKEHPKDEP